MKVLVAEAKKKSSFTKCKKQHVCHKQSKYDFHANMVAYSYKSNSGTRYRTKCLWKQKIEKKYVKYRHSFNEEISSSNRKSNWDECFPGNSQNTISM